MKKIFKILSVVLIISLCLFFSVEASSIDTVYLGGQSIGLKMNTGVYVAGKYVVKTKNGKISPWKSSNIEVGDEIIKVNNHEIKSNDELISYINTQKSDTILLLLKRKNQLIETKTNVVTNDVGNYSIGLYIKDQIQGIGTLSFATNNGYFASLGHGVYENTSLVNSRSGSIYFSSVKSLKKGIPGVAGEKRASINEMPIGEILKNDISGLYGKINTAYLNAPKIKISTSNEAQIGSATLYTVLYDNKVLPYKIEIIAIEKQPTKATKGIKFKVTDSSLLDNTGGVIQGMSGSPIVQNNKLIGAVSHVVIDNPTIGYGMYSSFMYDEVNDLIS